MKKGQVKDLTGKIFGRLTVLKLSHIKRISQWLCKCECGNEVVVTGNSMVIGDTKSCGCYRKERPTIEASEEKGSNWKGEKVKYRALHGRMYKKVPKPKLCCFCKDKPVTDLANISQEYKTTVDDWMWLCRGCHTRYDKGWIWKNKKWFKNCKNCNQVLEVNKQNFYLRASGKWVYNCKNCSRFIRRNK